MGGAREYHLSNKAATMIGMDPDIKISARFDSYPILM